MSKGKSKSGRAGPHPKGVVPPELAAYTFKPNQSGNPEGARLHSAETKALRKLSEQELKEIQNILIHGSLEDLQKIIKDKKSSVIQVMTARVAFNIIKTGNAAAWETFLTRLIGKPRENVNIQGSLEAKMVGQVIVQMPSNGREVP